MWSLGCIMAEMQTGYPLFPGENEQEQLACIMEIFGAPPKSILDTASRASLFFDQDGKPLHLVNSKGKKRRPGSKTLQQSMPKCQDELFFDFIARCLDWDPAKRLTPHEALEHPWMYHLYSASQTSRRVSSRRKTLTPASLSFPAAATGAGTNSLASTLTGIPAETAQPHSLPQLDVAERGASDSFSSGVLASMMMPNTAAKPSAQLGTTAEKTFPGTDGISALGLQMGSKPKAPLTTGRDTKGSAPSVPGDSQSSAVPTLPTALTGDDLDAVMTLLTSFPQPGPAPPPDHEPNQLHRTVLTQL